MCLPMGFEPTSKNMVRNCKDYDKSVIYQPEKANVVVDVLTRVSMGCVANVV